MNQDTDLSTNRSQANGVLVSDLLSAVMASTALDALPARLREVLASGAWKDFVIVSTGERVTYADDQFEQFVAAKRSRGLVLTVDRLLGLLNRIGGDDAEVARRLILDLVQPVRPHGGVREK